jgi:arylsulfatase A-like enzyme
MRDRFRGEPRRIGKAALHWLDSAALKMWESEFWFDFCFYKEADPKGRRFMRLGRVLGVVLASLVAIAIVGHFAYQRYWYLIPPLVTSIVDPVAPNHPVTWAQGPAMATLPPDKRPPNVVVILADDLGFNDVTTNGGGVADGAMPTPNIDSIARAGVKFTNGYAGNATCAPSRAAIMTGRFATRFGYEFTPTPPNFMKYVSQPSPDRLHQPIYYSQYEEQVPPTAQLTVPTSEITIAQVMHSKGYRTLALGKWHLGQTDATRPESRGFDEYLGDLTSSVYLPEHDPNVVNSRQEFDPIDRFLWAFLPFEVTFDRDHRFAPSEYLTDYLGKEAVKAIDANRNRPFFLYFAPTSPHTPLQALKSDYDALPQIKDHRLRVYAAMIRALDRNVGRILQALQKNGLTNNTLVVFTSDNGGAAYIGLPNINKPYRGWKETFFEGGIHVPYFMKWPAVIPAGSTFAYPVAHTDIFATAAAVAGAPMPRDRVMDGVNLLPFVTGKSQGRPHQSLFWRSGHYMTMLDGEWKIQFDSVQNKIWLFDLAKDPTEQHNIAASDEAETKAMFGKLTAMSNTMAKPLWPQLGDAPIDIDHPLGVPETAKDEFIYWGN